MATNLVDWLDADGDVEHVPPHVKQALEAPWRGQDDLKGAKARATDDPIPPASSPRVRILVSSSSLT